MAKIDISYTARLARLELSGEERERYTRQLGNVLEYFEILSSVDTGDVEPMAHANPLSNVWREDKAVQGLSPQEALANAPKQRDNQVVVPRVVE